MSEESMEYSAESYANEPARFPALEIVDLKAEGERASESAVSYLHRFILLFDEAPERS